MNFYNLKINDDHNGRDNLFLSERWEKILSESFMYNRKTIQIFQNKLPTYEVQSFLKKN